MEEKRSGSIRVDMIILSVLLGSLPFVFFSYYWYVDKVRGFMEIAFYTMVAGYSFIIMMIGDGSHLEKLKGSDLNLQYPWSTTTSRDILRNGSLFFGIWVIVSIVITYFRLGGQDLLKAMIGATYLIGYGILLHVFAGLEMHADFGNTIYHNYDMEPLERKLVMRGFMEYLEEEFKKHKIVCVEGELGFVDGLKLPEWDIDYTEALLTNKEYDSFITLGSKATKERVLQVINIIDKLFDKRYRLIRDITSKMK